MENIVRISDLSRFVQDTLDGIRNGVAAARATGLLVELPEEVSFTALVIQDWQALEITGSDKTESREEQGGGTTEVQNSSNAETRKQNSSQLRKDGSTGDKTERQTTKNTASESRTVTQNGPDTNEHIQKNETTYDRT